MKTLNLTFVQRVKLNGFLGSMRGLALSEMRDLGKVYDQVRFSGEELAQVESEDKGHGLTFFKTSAPEMFEKAVTVESPALLRNRLEGFHDYGVEDGWVDEVLEMLSAPVPKKAGKK